jgi:hypothetical protein
VSIECEIQRRLLKDVLFVLIDFIFIVLLVVLALVSCALIDAGIPLEPVNEPTES